MKDELRRIVKERLKKVETEELNAASDVILERLVCTDEFVSASRVFVYLSFGKEVKTQKIIESALRMGKKVSIPKLVGDDMISIAYESVKSSYVDEYGITEPMDGEVVAPDLIILPLLAFDGDKNRLGRGKGYYDKFCKNAACPTVAIALNAQKVERIPADEWDFTPDVIISEKEIIR